MFLGCKLINAIADSIDKSLEFERLTANMSNLKKNWKYEEVQALIHLVRKYPSLYDRRDPDYNQARTKEVNIPIHSSMEIGIFIQSFSLFINIQNIWKTISASPPFEDKNGKCSRSACGSFPDSCE